MNTIKAPSPCLQTLIFALCLLLPQQMSGDETGASARFADVDVLNAHWRWDPQLGSIHFNGDWMFVWNDRKWIYVHPDGAWDSGLYLFDYQSSAWAYSGRPWYPYIYYFGTLNRWISDGFQGAWRYPQTLADALSAETGGEATELGNLASHSVEARIPAAALPAGTVLTLTHPPHPQSAAPHTFTPLGVPVKLTAEGYQERFEEAVTVTLAFDIEGISEAGEVTLAYHHPDYGWYLFAPDEVNIESGRAVFETQHFSWFTAAKLSDEERRRQFIEKRSVEQYVRGQSAEKSAGDVEQAVKDILQQGLGVYDSRVLEIITRAVVKELPGGKIGMALYDHNASAFVNETLATTFDTLASNVNLLEDAGVGAGKIGALAGASGAFSEGDYEGGLRILSSEIAGSLPVISTLKSGIELGVKLTEHVMRDLWLKPEVDKAYRAYRDGAHSRWLGYDCNPGDFAAVSDQMRGALRQLKIDYVNAWCKAQNISADDLPSWRRDQLRAEAVENLKTQFEQRANQEADIERIREENALIFEELEEWGLLRRRYGNPMYSGHDDQETLMTRLYRMIEKVKRDTGRFEVIPVGNWWGTEESQRDGLLPRQWISELIYTWYSKGPEAYATRLVELGLIEPEIIDLTGKWTGSWVVTYSAIDEEDFDPEDWEGCDEALAAAIAQMFEDLKGAAVPMEMDMARGNTDERYNATLWVKVHLVLDDSDPTEASQVTVSFRNDTVRFTDSRDGQSIIYEGRYQPPNRLSGTFVMPNAGATFASGTWSVSR